MIKKEEYLKDRIYNAIDYDYKPIMDFKGNKIYIHTNKSINPLKIQNKLCNNTFLIDTEEVKFIYLTIHSIDKIKTLRISRSGIINIHECIKKNTFEIIKINKVKQIKIKQ